MRDLVLVLPDLSLAESDTAPARGAALTRLRFALAAPLRGGWRGMMARGLGRADLMAVDPAEVVAAALVPPVAPGSFGDLWLVTPLHLVPGLKTVHLSPSGLLRLPEDEIAQLCADFDHTFGDDGLRLHPVAASGFLLQGLEAAGALTVEPSRLLAGAIEESLPGGAGGAVLRAFLTECEMWLHALPLNRQRERRGDAPITTLWLWGGGNPLREPLAATQGEGRWARVWADESWVSALGRLTGQPVAALPAGIERVLTDEADSGCLVLPVVERGFANIDRSFLAPLAEALRSGRLARLTVAADDRAVSVTAGDRHRFWRPQRDLLSALLEGGA